MIKQKVLKYFQGLLMVVVLTALTVLPFTMVADVAIASSNIDSQLIQLKNIGTNRYLFSTGDIFTGEPGDEGGWEPDKNVVVGADANYLKRGLFYLEKRGNTYLLKNFVTNRYVFATGKPFTGEPGDEGGWIPPKNVVGADANYYNRAQWNIIKRGNAYLLVNKETNRQILSDGVPFKGEPGDEKGWFNSPIIAESDANYYNRSLWQISGPGASLLED